MDEEIINLEKDIKTSLASKNIGISRMASLKYCQVWASQNGTVFTAPGEGGNNKLLTILGMTYTEERGFPYATNGMTSRRLSDGRCRTAMKKGYRLTG